MSEAIIEPEADGCLRRIPLDNTAKIAFSFSVAAAQQDEKKILRQKIVQNRHNEVESFLNINSRNHGQNGPFGLRWVQPELPEQCFLICHFSGKIGHAERRRDHWVGFGIPYACVN